MTTPQPARDENACFQVWLPGLPCESGTHAVQGGNGGFPGEQAGKLMPCLVGEASRNNLSHSIKENV